MENEVKPAKQELPIAPPAKEPTVTMRHPHTKDTVEAIQSDLIPLMMRGYQQVQN